MASDIQSQPKPLSAATRIYAAEFLGTAVLVFLGCGSVVASSMNSAPTGLFGIAAAFGLAVSIMIYAIGPISGAHINPAVTIALAAVGRFPRARVLPTVTAQLAGAAFASLLHLVLFTHDVASRAAYGATSPTVSAGAAVGIEIVLTFILMFVIMAFATGPDAPAAMAASGIGLAVVVNIIVGGPATGASMNPARSLGPALFAGGAPLSNYWIYLVGPIIGSVLAALAYESLRERVTVAEAVAVVEEPVLVDPAGR